MKYIEWCKKFSATIIYIYILEVYGKDSWKKEYIIQIFIIFMILIQIDIWYKLCVS